MSTMNDLLKPMFDDSLEALGKITTIDCSDKDLETLRITPNQAGSSNIGNIIGSHINSAAITRKCLLCDNSTRSVVDMICPRCQKIWNILIDTFQGDIENDT